MNLVVLLSRKLRCNIYLECNKYLEYTIIIFSVQITLYWYLYEREYLAINEKWGVGHSSGHTTIDLDILSCNKGRFFTSQKSRHISNLSKDHFVSQITQPNHTSIKYYLFWITKSFKSWSTCQSSTQDFISLDFFKHQLCHLCLDEPLHKKLHENLCNSIDLVLEKFNTTTNISKLTGQMALTRIFLPFNLHAVDWTIFITLYI